MEKGYLCGEVCEQVFNKWLKLRLSVNIPNLWLTESAAYSYDKGVMWRFNQKQETSTANSKIESDLSTQSFDLLHAIDAESVVITSTDRVIY